MTTRIPGPSGIAAFAAARRLFNEPSVTIEALAEKYGRTFALHFGVNDIVIVGDRALVQVVLSGPQDRYRWGPLFRLPLGVFAGPTSLLVSDGEKHRRRRAIVQPAFALRRLQTWRALVVDELDRMIDALPLGTQLDLAPEIQRAIRRIVVRVLFGDALDPDEVGERLAVASAYVNRPMAKQPPHPFPWGDRQRARESRRSFDVLLDAEVARREASAATPDDDVLSALLADETLSRQELRDQVVSLIGAGYDTTTATASWLVLRSAPRADVWDRLRDEAETTPLDARPFADAVVREALRLHPAGAFAPRLVAKSFELGEHRVRRASVVAWSPLLTGRDPDSWPDPMRFDPNRHVGTEEPPYAWTPFGAGSRSCIGMGLARMNLAMLASRLAQRTTLHVADGRLPRPVGTVTAHPEGGLPVTLTARS